MIMRSSGKFSVAGRAKNIQRLQSLNYPFLTTFFPNADFALFRLSSIALEKPARSSIILEQTLSRCLPADHSAKKAVFLVIIGLEKLAVGEENWAELAATYAH